MTTAGAAAATTRTELLGGRVVCDQPAAGFRVAIDAILLAAAVPAERGEAALDVGTGSGAAALALAARVAEIRVDGLEQQGDLIALAAENAVLSGLAERVRFHRGDLLAPPPELAAGTFDHVLANPPYMKAGAGQVPDDPAKARATIEGAARLGDWLDFCARMVRPGGTVTMVHRRDRLDEVLAGFAKFAGPTAVLPLLPQAGGRAKRVIVQGRRGGDHAVTHRPGFVLHEAGRKYTDAAESVLRDASPLLVWGDDGRD